jgi:hypothetical protein
MTQPDSVPYEVMKARFEADQLLWDRKIRRMRRLGNIVLVPYGLAGAGAGVTLATMHEAGKAFLVGACFAVVVLCQWTQPYLQRRGDRKDSISETASPTGC